MELEGQVYRTGKTKKGQFFCNVLVKRPDGQQDSVTVFSTVEHKVGVPFKAKVNAYVQMVSEVV
ncbi:MAG: hypothetical protein Q8M92_05850 [Candidatus Subteraquimicrobiales bacterium]|nr:hypothetical protein [Candidatus Subteraquimicrobiales bacterium]